MKIDPNIYKGKKHTEERSTARFGAMGSLLINNAMEGLNVLACVCQNNAEVDNKKRTDRAEEEYAGNQTYNDWLRMTASSESPQVNLAKFKLAIVTFTEKTWIYHGDNFPLRKDLLEWCYKLKESSIMSDYYKFTTAYL